MARRLVLCSLLAQASGLIVSGGIAPRQSTIDHPRSENGRMVLEPTSLPSLLVAEYDVSSTVTAVATVFALPMMVIGAQAYISKVAETSTSSLEQKRMYDARENSDFSRGDPVRSFGSFLANFKGADEAVRQPQPNVKSIEPPPSISPNPNSFVKPSGSVADATPAVRSLMPKADVASAATAAQSELQIKPTSDPVRSVGSFLANLGKEEAVRQPQPNVKSTEPLPSVSPNPNSFVKPSGSVADAMPALRPPMPPANVAPAANAAQSVLQIKSTIPLPRPIPKEPQPAVRPPPPPEPLPAIPMDMDTVAPARVRLAQLRSLSEKGLVDAAEFEAARIAILDSI